jgi:four helix bundle protein
VGDFKELKVWQRSREVVVAVYAATAALPPDERDGLTSQLRRAATSIASNIAESRGRHSDRDQLRFLRMALGSAREVECKLMLVQALGLLPPDQLMMPLGLIDEVERMLTTLIRKSRE